MVKEIINKVKKIINNLARPGENLSESVVRGGFWVFLLRIVQQLFNLIRLVILTRILAPHDFGLMGIALLTMVTLETFSQTGFQQALIQKKEDIKSYLDSVWTVLILRGFILFAILYFIAPYAVIFFNTPEAKPIIQVLSLSFLLQSFENIGVVYFQKELEFNKQFIYQLSGTLADFVVAVSAVLILRNIWALVFGLLAGNVARCFVSYLIHPYRPHLSSDLWKAKKLFGFGGWILGSSILVFLITQGDDIFVGKLLGATVLGFYQMAYRISNMPATEITHVISQVTFPAYSKLQDDIPKLREAYLKVLQFTAFLSFPIAGLIFVLSPDFARIFLGEKWMPMVPAMQMLALWGVLRAIGATSSPILQAIGKPKVNTMVQLSTLIVFAILIYPFSAKLGILGTSLALVLTGLVNNLIRAPLAIKYTTCGTWNFCRMIIFPVICTTIMVSFIFILKMYWANPIGIYEFLAFIVLGILLYSGIVYLFDEYLGYRLCPTAKESIALLFRR